LVKNKEANQTLDFDEVRMPRLLSVNVGLPRDVTWNGKTVRTSVWKSPVDGRRMVRKLDIDGDAQADLAGHGGEHRAVFVYLQKYARWAAKLGRTRRECAHRNLRFCRGYYPWYGAG
jgi:MOSC domain-containing protein YiiM